MMGAAALKGAKRGPKVCTICGTRGACYDTRQLAEHVRRLYRCKCGQRWTTYEVTVEDE